MSAFVLVALLCISLAGITWSIHPKRDSIAEAIIAILLFVAASCLFGSFFIGLIEVWEGEFLR